MGSNQIRFRLAIASSQGRHGMGVPMNCRRPSSLTTQGRTCQGG
jgi:hypothetical protein